MSLDAALVARPIGRKGLALGDALTGGPRCVAAEACTACRKHVSGAAWASPVSRPLRRLSCASVALQKCIARALSTLRTAAPVASTTPARTAVVETSGVVTGTAIASTGAISTISTKATTAASSTVAAVASESCTAASATISTEPDADATVTCVASEAISIRPSVHATKARSFVAIPSTRRLRRSMLGSTLRPALRAGALQHAVRETALTFDCSVCHLGDLLAVIDYFLA